MLGIVWISLPYQGMFGCFQWIGHVDHLNTRENRKIAGKKAFRSDRYFPISAGVPPTHSIYWGPLPHTHTYIYTHLFSCLGLGVLRNIGTHRTYIYNHTHIYILVTFSYSIIVQSWVGCELPGVATLPWRCGLDIQQEDQWNTWTAVMVVDPSARVWSFSSLFCLVDIFP